MRLHSIRQRRLDYSRSNLRILLSFFSLICISSILRCQLIDSLVHIRAEISGEYSDIIRQHADYSSATVFARSFEAEISASHGFDTLVLAYSGWNQYASYNNHASEIALSTNNGLRSLSLQWISSFNCIDYSAEVFFPFSQKVFPLYYSAWIRLNPFNKIFVPEFSYERLPISSASGLGLKDFSFPLDEHCINSAWNITLKSQPVKFMEGSFSWGKSISEMAGVPVWYSSPFDWNTQTFSALLKIYPEEKSSFWIGWKRREEKGEMSFTKDGLSFGDLAYGEFISKHWQAGASIIILSLPVLCEYDFYRLTMYGVGHFESWPFTTVASTVFDNRLYYKIDGNIDVHRIESRTSVAWGDWIIKPSFGFLYILPDLLWRQWEPDFIVFGIKNVKEEPLSIQQCWLLRLGCEVDFSLLGMNIEIQVEQYIPMSIKKREKQLSNVEPGTPAVSGTPSSTDGGRRIQLKVILP